LGAAVPNQAGPRRLAGPLRAGSGETDARSLRSQLAPYATPDSGRAIFCLGTSVLPYLALSVTLYVLLQHSALAVLLVVPTAAFLVRSFIVFHDCSHGSFLASRRMNQYLGRSIGMLLYSPFTRWRHDHAVHHASSGDLDRRGTGDVLMLTVAEYEARSPRGRLAYRLLRNPLVMFGVGPIVALMVGPRIVAKDARPRMRRSVLVTDVAVLAMVALLVWLIGWEDYLIVVFLPALLAGSAGIWLFYVQHQFEDVYWDDGDDWSFTDAALRGSSFLKLPAVLRFCSGNIGYHHVHHLNAGIPNYNLRRAHDDTPALHDVPTLTFMDGLRATRLKLYDERRRRLVTFREAGGAPARAISGADSSS